MTTIIQFPTRAPARPARRRRKNRASEKALYPRRFHPLREHTPFFMPILVSVIGTVLALGAGYALVEIQRTTEAGASESTAGKPERD